LDVLSRINPSKTQSILDESRNDQAIMTHHDAITGTSPQPETNDYTQRIFKGVNAAQEVIKRSYNYLKNKNNSTNDSEVFCNLLNITDCGVTESNDKIAVTLYNPIARPVSQYISIPVVNNNHKVYESNGQAVSHSAIVSISDAVKRVPERHSKATNELLFKVDLPALGFNTYFIEKQGALKSKSLYIRIQKV